MATVYRFKVALTGFIGGPGMNTWHMAQFNATGGADQSDLEGMAGSIADVYDAVRTYIPNTVRMAVQPIVEGFDVATGQLVQVTGIEPPAENAGASAGGGQSRATQVCVRLKTDAIRGNRLMQGRHFLGPVGDNALGQDGQINSTCRNAVSAAYGGILDVAGDGRLVVWGQPSKKDPDRAVGLIGYVQQALPNTVPGTLRSRKR